jgi:hypothetical protein
LCRPFARVFVAFVNDYNALERTMTTTNAFTRALIANAKTGTHFLAWQPGRPAQEYRAVTVRAGGSFVEVEPVEWNHAGSAPRYALNQTASRKLVNGDYRRR